MTFKQIVDAVLRNRFDESDRVNAKDWVNHRYAWILALEEWRFLNAAAAVTVTGGNAILQGVPADFGIALGVYNASGEPLEGVPGFTDFYDRYQGVGAGTPEAFTVVGGNVVLGPAPAATETGWLLPYEKDVTPLSADSDVPIIPAGFHLGLVHGGRSEGMKLQHDSTWRDVEQDFLASIDAMRRRHLVGMRSQSFQWSAWRPV